MVGGGGVVLVGEWFVIGCIRSSIKDKHKDSYHDLRVQHIIHLCPLPRVAPWIFIE